MLKNFLVVAWRNIRRHKGYAAIHVIGLGVGICACMAIWTLTHYQLSFDKRWPDRDRIYRVVTEIADPAGKHQYWGDIPEPGMPAIRRQVPGLEKVAQFHTINPMITITGPNGRQTKFFKSDDGENYSVFAEPEYFDLFNYQWVAGDPSTLKEPYHLVLTESGARKYFGETGPAGVVGKIVLLDDSIPLTVTGIVKDPGQVTEFTFTNFISYATARVKLTNDLAVDNWGNSNSASETFVKLAKGVSVDRVNAALNAITREHRKDIWGNDSTTFYRWRLQPFADLHYSTDYDKDYGTQADMSVLYKLMGVAVFILILASINFINLSTAQALRRAKEIGVRKVLGSRRVGLVLQFMSETLMLALFSMVLSLILLKPLLAAFPSFVPAGLKISLMDPSTIGFALGVVLAAALLSGLYPALVLSSFRPARVLKGDGGMPGSMGTRLARVLVVFQFTISAVFVISAIVVADQMRHMLHKDLGFKEDAVIRFAADFKDPVDRKELLAAKLRALPGVAAVSMDMLPPAINGRSTTTIETKANEKMSVNLRMSDTNYIPMYQLKLLAGRNYFASDTLVEVVINNSFAKALGYKRPEDAVGQPLPMWGRRPMIVGVLADFDLRSAQYGIEPAVLFDQKSSETGFDVKLRGTGKTAAEMKSTIAGIGREWAPLFPDEPFKYQWMDESIAKFYNESAKTETLVNLAMMITIVVSGMGLFGLAALAAGKRTREIGIRKVLGAGVGNITVMITREFVLLVVIALLIASPVAWYILHDWLQGYAYRVGIGWWVFGLAGFGAVGVAVLTVGFHAVRAALVSPVESIRTQ